MLRNAHILARLLTTHSWPQIGRVDVVLGLPDSGGYDVAAERSAVRAISDAVSVRMFRWASFDRGAAQLLFPPHTLPDGSGQVAVPDDGFRQFRDVDGWIYFSNHSCGAVAWLRPTAVFCADLLPRRVGGVVAAPVGDVAMAALADTMIAWRAARCVFATTPQTRDDAISYAGVHPDRSLLVPLQTEAVGNAVAAEPPGRVGSSPGVVWVTNLALHKNHRNSVLGMAAYIAAGGALGLTVCGTDTAALDPSLHAEHRALAPSRPRRRCSRGPSLPGSPRMQPIGA